MNESIPFERFYFIFINLSKAVRNTKEEKDSGWMVTDCREIDMCLQDSVLRLRALAVGYGYVFVRLWYHMLLEKSQGYEVRKKKNKPSNKFVDTLLVTAEAHLFTHKFYSNI